MYRTFELLYQTGLCLQVFQNELESLQALEPSVSHVQGDIISLPDSKSTTSHTLTSCLTLAPPTPILKLLAEKRSVKTGYLYFYWFLQTMTTFPERQCQETINVCKKEVKVLMSINCLVPQETAA